MHNLKLYKENQTNIQKYIALTNQKQILIDKVCKKIIENNISKKLSFLDIGCADGIVTDQIIDKLIQLYQIEVTGIETSKELINQFESRTNYDINFINENVELLDKLPKSDFVLLAHVVSYIDNLEKFIDKVINSLNIKGIALIVVSNDYSDDKKVKNILKGQKIEDMNENGKTIIEFFKHKVFEEISSDEINNIRNTILNIANENKKIIKREDYIWIMN